MKSWLMLSLLIFTLASSLVLADQEATTRDGRMVVLMDDGTWRYVSDDEQCWARTRQLFDVLGAESKLVDSSSAPQWKFKWTLTIRNKGPEQLTFKATLEWLDSYGCWLDDVTQYGLTVNAGETKTFANFNLINVSDAQKVASIRPTVKACLSRVSSE